jgi:hypothetical protein
MDMAQSTHTVSGDFGLTMDELRVVARFVVRHAEDVRSVFEQAIPGDPRPRAAIDAAWAFINGARRTKLQRVTSLQRATPVLIDVLRRYPPATSGSNRVAQLRSTLDQSLRQAADRSPEHTALSRADARSRQRTS